LRCIDVNGNSIGGGCAIAGMGGAATGVGVVFGSFIEAIPEIQKWGMSYLDMLF